MNTNPFSRSTARVLVLVIGASLLVGLGGMLLGVQPRAPSAGADSTSHSALGHSAFLELLERSGVPVVVSRLPRAIGSGSLRLLIEPELGTSEERKARTHDFWDESERVLLVLPKWSGAEDDEHAGWVGSVELRAPAECTAALATVEVKAELTRPDVTALAWHEPYGFLPSLAHPQLLHSEALEPVIACAEGILLGRVRDAPGEHWVLADPDLLANHGLGQGDNAALALAIVGQMVAAGAPVVVDETLHEGVVARALGRELLGFPLVLVVVQAVLASVLFLWSAVRRLSPPLPAPPALRRGQGTLVDNTARLLLSGGHHADTLERYLGNTLQSVAEERHLPPQLEAPERLERLARLSRRRNLEEDPSSLETAARSLEQAPGGASSASVLRVARRIHSWREGMLHGSHDGPRARP